jgi:photosystem II stability/assembly factor-like uncharacterized protein
MKQKIFALICLSLLLGGGLWLNKTRNFEPQKTKQKSPILEPMAFEDELERGEDETDVEERNDWFFYQRAYPFGAIPADARRKAWEAIGRGKIETQAANLTWTPIGPSPTQSAFMSNWGLTSGRINAIAISPTNANLILIGSATGGIFRSVDGGNTFAPVTDTLADLAVGSIAFAKSNPRIVYAGMGDTRTSYLGSGVLKSTDAGQTWSRVSDQSLPTPGNVAKIEVDPTNPNKVYLAQYARLSDNRLFSSGFYFSTDGGVSWTKVLSGLPRDLAIDLVNANTIYVAMSRVDAPANTPAGIYRSTDAGQSFSRIFTSPYDLGKTNDMRLALTPASTQTMYVYTGGTAGTTFDIRVNVSTDGGQTWANRGSTGIDPAQFAYNTYIAVDPTNANTVYVGARDVFKSTDGGVTWNNKTKNFFLSGDFWAYNPRGSNAHPDQHCLSFISGSGSEFVIGNDGGFFKTFNGGDSFTSLNTSLNLSMFVSMAVHPTNPAISYGGTQDNGTQKRLASSNIWQEFATGDGGNVVINPVDPSVVYTTYVRGVVYRFTNNGLDYDRQIASSSTFGEPDSSSARIAFYPPFTTNGADGTLYIGSYRLFVSTDSGSTWNPPAGDLDLTKGITANGRDVLTAIGVSPVNKNLIYTGSRQGRVMVSTNNGASWNDVTTGLPDRSITSIKIDPTNAAVAYVTLSGFDTSHVFKTTNTGATWTDASAGLFNVPANALLFDPLDNNTLYVGTDIGVFRSTNSGASWQAFNDGLPPVVVTSFSAQRNGLIQIGTYGRGAFEINQGGNRPVISNVDFNGVKALVITGSNFGSAPQVFINGVNQAERLRTFSDTKLKLKGKANQFGFQSGDNLIKVVGDGGISSETVTYRF